MNDLIVKLAEERAASLPEDRLLSSSKTDKLYEFDSVPEGEEILVRMIGFMTYMFKFRAKNMKVTGNPLEVFQVTADQLRGGALVIQESISSINLEITGATRTINDSLVTQSKASSVIKSWYMPTKEFVASIIFGHQSHQNLVVTLQPQVLKQLRDGQAKSGGRDFTSGGVVMHMWQVGETPRVLDPVQLLRIHLLVLVQEHIEPNLNLDESLGFVIEEELSLEPIGVGDIRTVATEGLPKGPHAVYVGMVAIKHRIFSSRIEVTHVLIMSSPRITHPSVDRVVRDVLDGPHARVLGVVISAKRSNTYPLRWSWLRYWSYSGDDSSSSKISGRIMPCGLSQFQEEEPCEVDLIGLIVELISSIAVSAVDVSLLVEVSGIIGGKLLHFLNGVHKSAVEGRATRVRHFIGAVGNDSSAALGNVRGRDRVGKGKGVGAAGQVVCAVETPEAQKDISPVKFRRRETVRVFTPLRGGCAPDLDVTTSCNCPAGVEKDLGRSGKVKGRRLGGEGNVFGA
nr:hypothetical protein TorRG33x02_273870 [Ipomoea batatas]